VIYFTKISKKEDDKMNNRNTAYKIAIDETLSTLKQLDDNIWIMEYKCSYGLDGILKQGTKGIMDAVRFLQNEVKLTPNGEKDGFACSTYNAVTPDGDYILGRNFDYKAAPCLVCWTKPEKGYRSMSVVDTTFFIHGTKYFPVAKAKNHLRSLAAPYTSMDGINEKGFSIAVLEIKSKATKQKTGKTPIITTVAIRAALDKCATVQEGIELFASYDMQDLLGINYHYQLADAKGNSAIIEYVDNKMVVISQEEGKENLILTNYFLTPGGDNHDGRGYDRYEKIETTLKAKGGVITEEEAMKLLSEVTLHYKHPALKHMVITLWSSVYNCSEKSMLMCAGMNYDKMYKFYVDKPCEVTEVK
jgi:hypothetical protein